MRAGDRGPGRTTLAAGALTLLALAAVADLVAGDALVSVADCEQGCARHAITLGGVLVAAPAALVAVALQAVALQALHQASGRPRPDARSAVRVAAVVSATLLAIAALVVRSG